MLGPDRDRAYRVMQIRTAGSVVLVLTALVLSACAANRVDTASTARSMRAATPVLASPATIVRVQASPTGSDDVVCVQDRFTGSHREATLCKTRDEWDRERREAQTWLRSGGRQGAVSIVPTVH